MPYTLWSRGRLLGQSTLAYAPSFRGLRMGDFEPSDLGEKLMPILVGVGPALRAFYRVLDESYEGGGQGEAHPSGVPDAVRNTTEYADAQSIPDELEALELELRDPDGAVMATDWISVRDTEYLINLGRELELDELLGYEGDPPWDPDLERDIEHAVEAPKGRFRDLDQPADGREGLDDLEYLDDWDDDPPDWLADDDEGSSSPPPRYQLMVMLEGAERRWAEERRK